MHRLIIIIALFTVSLLMASEPIPFPPPPSISTWSWLPPPIVGDFKLQKYPEDSINLTYTVQGSIVPHGYPYHYGAVWGVNDTVFITVLFENNSNNDMSFIGLQPQDWFYPVLYDHAVDVFTTEPLADASAFKYRFEHWINMLNRAPTVRPDTLRSYPIHQWKTHPRGLVLSLWNIYPGRYRVVLLPTSSKPSNVNLVMATPNNHFLIVKGSHVKDTINAFVSISEGAIRRQEWTLANAYIDSIFNRNPKAVPGWSLRYLKYLAIGDSLSAEIATDSVLYLLENYKDPLLPDSSNLDEVHESWIEDKKSSYIYLRWRLRNPGLAKHYLPL